MDEYKDFLVFILFMEVFDIANNKDNLINEQIKSKEIRTSRV